MQTDQFSNDKINSLPSKVNIQKILIIYSVAITLLTYLFYLKLDFKTKQYEEILPKYRSLTQFKTTLTPTSTPVITNTEEIPCLVDKDTIYSQDKNFAACLEKGEYMVFKKSDSLDTAEYRRFWEETGRIETEEEILISYADYYSTNYGLRPHEIGSSVYRIDKINRTLELLFEALDIPNIRDWISGSEFRPQFILFNSGESWTFSPDKNIMLLLTAECTGCSTTLYLYAYDFANDKLTFVGEPYIVDYQNESEKFEINWLDTKTLTWREGNWRERKREEYNGSDFPVIQDDLGYKTTQF